MTTYNTELRHNNGTDYSDLIYVRTNWELVDDKPTTYPPTAHTHDDRYYTESEITSLLGAKLSKDGSIQMTGPLDMGTQYIIMQENQYINRRFEMLENVSPQYILLCVNAASNNVNGRIQMDRTSGNYQAVILDVIVSSGTGAMYGGTLKTLQVLQSSEDYRLVTVTYNSVSYVAIKYTGNSYPETTGAYFTGRIVTTGSNMLTVVDSTGITDEATFGGNSEAYYDVDNLVVNGNVTAGGQVLVKTNDSRLSDARVASDVYSWAKASTKPSYIASEVGALTASAKGETANKTLAFGGTFKVLQTSTDGSVTERTMTMPAISNNYLTGVSGSGNGTVTFTRSGLTDLIWNASHNHSVTNLSALSASRALMTNPSGTIAPSAVTATELGYLSGVTGAIQTQINDKAPKSHASSDSMYGVATSSVFGHVKVGSNINVSAGVISVPAASQTVLGLLKAYASGTTLYLSTS